jgi:nucleotide-binding universal stress UspA family protein
MESHFYGETLVTLDGSRPSASVMPWAASVVNAGLVRTLILLMVVEEQGDRQVNMAESYLREQAGRLEGQIKNPHQEVAVQQRAVVKQTGGTADTILRFADENAIDLIMTSSQGRSGVQRWVLGTVAERVLRAADIPVFMVNSISEPIRPDGRVSNILLPLDGSERAESIVPHAEALAAGSSGEVTLLFVDDGSQRPANTERKRDMMAYLGYMGKNLSERGIKVNTVIREGYPAEVILDLAEEGGVNLVAMTTHGRTGLARWAFGNVADKVLHATPVPVLIVPAAMEGTVPPHLRGPRVRRCHNCRRLTYLASFDASNKCVRCGYSLRACDNCTHFTGFGCTLQLPYSSEARRGNRCPEFDFQSTRLILR